MLKLSQFENSEPPEDRQVMDLLKKQRLEDEDKKELDEIDDQLQKLYSKAQERTDDRQFLD